MNKMMSMRRKLADISIPNWLKVGFKIIFSVLALMLVFSKVEFSEVIEGLSGLSWEWTTLALVLYFVSKFASVFRYDLLLREINVDVPFKELFKLYWLGLFYNLTLPGGIGGDGYKAIKVQQGYENGYKQNIALLLFDRSAGMFVVIVLILMICQFLPVLDDYNWMCLPLIAVGFVCYYVIARYMFPSFVRVRTKALFYSVVIQISQLVMVLCLLKALGHYLDPLSFLLLFYCSTMATILPVSIGGLGTRELVFLYGSQLLNVPSEIAITVSFLVYLLTVVCSMVGILFLFYPPVINKHKEHV